LLTLQQPGSYQNRPADKENPKLVALTDYSERPLYAGRYIPFGWSPNGNSVYATGFDSSEILEIDVHNSKNPRKITTIPKFMYGTAITPDGRKLILSMVEEFSDIWIMENFDPETSKPNRVQ